MTDRLTDLFRGAGRTRAAATLALAAFVSLTLGSVCHHHDADEHRPLHCLVCEWSAQPAHEAPTRTEAAISIPAVAPVAAAPEVPHVAPHAAPPLSRGPPQSFAH